jgi:hypothetical protein
MVQVVPNWAHVEGVVRGVTPNGRFLLVDLQVERVSDVDRQRNLFSDAEGKRLAIAIPEQAARSAGVREGVSLFSRIRRAGPSTTYAHPDHVRVRR